MFVTENDFLRAANFLRFCPGKGLTNFKCEFIFYSAQMYKNAMRCHFVLVGAEGGIDDVDRTCK